MRYRECILLDMFSDKFYGFQWFFVTFVDWRASFKMANENLIALLYTNGGKMINW